MGCGGQEDVSLATTGLVDEIEDRWRNGGDGGDGSGDGIIDSLTEVRAISLEA